MCINKTTIEKWIEAKKDLDKAKRIELELRDKIIKDAQERNAGILEGTTHHQFGEYDVSVAFKTTKSIDQAVLDSIWESLSDAEKEAIEYKPSLKLAAYRKVEDSVTLAQAITVKPAQASVSFKIIE